MSDWNVLIHQIVLGRVARRVREGATIEQALAELAGHWESTPDSPEDERMTYVSIREVPQMCFAPDAGGCSLQGLGASGGLERVQPIVCLNCQLLRQPCSGCSWGVRYRSTARPMGWCYADEVPGG